MKKLSLFFCGLVFLLMTLQVNAQAKKGADYFEGKWRVSIPGTPLGDLVRLIVLEKKDNTLSGLVRDDATGAELAPISKVDVNDNEATIYYTANGIDANLVLTKKDEDHTTGSLLGEYPAKGTRVK
ncbi:hypothetical protein HNV11_01205 [Spirosoma taeanense]|uniref:Uncharacterized protein n=1 Tax=Spirosoma taeanense TaxID=2735870 RepID=A0A6M5XZV4_9BACT|nr:hypothetical protein [Spirosoma taeanense]QJW88088.1 hypothetical protein HNV11_01205 [Spirosoma taeanense]